MATTTTSFRRQRGSHELLVRLVVGIMKASPHHPATAPLAVYYTKRFVEAFEDGLSPASKYEYATAPTFYRLFDGLLTLEDLAGKDVLDLAALDLRNRKTRSAKPARSACRGQCGQPEARHFAAPRKGALRGCGGEWPRGPRGL